MNQGICDERVGCIILRGSDRSTEASAKCHIGFPALSPLPAGAKGLEARKGPPLPEGMALIFESTACQGPSHGGSYMDEGTSHIRIGLPPHVVSGDCLASHSHVMLPSLFACVYLMSDDTGLYWYVASSIPDSCMCPWGLCFLIMRTSTCMVVGIPWWTTPYMLTTDYSPHVCWCSMGFTTIPLLLVTVLGSRYFSYWYDNTGWCGL